MTTVAASDRSETTPTELAVDLLDALRRVEDTEEVLSALASLPESALDSVRVDQPTALAFWLNCYNAGTKRLLAERPDLYDSRWRFFRATALTIAGHPLGLDDIEHGILRGSRSKYGLGYVPRLLPDSFELRYRLGTVDPRIHFALNCGAASCPAIRAYDPDRIDEQLDLATRVYLDDTVKYDPDSAVVRVPRVFRWFPGDFARTAGTLALLREHDQIPVDATPTVRYLDWDWSRTEPPFVG